MVSSLSKIIYPTYPYSPSERSLRWLLAWNCHLLFSEKHPKAFVHRLFWWKLSLLSNYSSGDTLCLPLYLLLLLFISTKIKLSLLVINKHVLYEEFYFKLFGNLAEINLFLCRTQWSASRSLRASYGSFYTF